MNNEIIKIVKQLCIAENVADDFFREMANTFGYPMAEEGVVTFDKQGHIKYLSPKEFADEIEDDYGDITFLVQYFLNTRGEVDKLPEVLRNAIINSPEYKSLTKNETRTGVDGAVAELWEHPKENNVVFAHSDNFADGKSTEYCDTELLSKFVGGLKPKKNENEITL